MTDHHDSLPQQRMGAAAVDPSHGEVLTDVTDLGHNDDLPQTVWLIGTEPWFSEFCLDADQVMVMLGIKRTRLTQISGRELRVGRVRRGRYVSPVFRPQDVEHYLNWSRAPVSHIKSSTMLNEAADALKQQADELEQQFSDLKNIITGDFEAGIRRAMLSSQELTAEARAQINASFLAFSQQMSERMAWLAKRQDGLSTQLATIFEAFDKLQAGQMTILKCLQESQVRTADELGAKITRLEDLVVESMREEEPETPRRPGRVIIRDKQQTRVRPLGRIKSTPIEDPPAPAPVPVRLRMLRARILSR